MNHSLRMILSVGTFFLLLSSLLSASAADGVHVTPLPPVEETDERGGICFSYYPGDPDRPYLPLARRAGSRWDRFDFSWPNIEKEDSVWQFDGHDELVEDMGDAGMNVVGILLWTPSWASTGRQHGQPLSSPEERPSDWYAPSLLAPQAPSSSASSPPRGLYEEWHDWTTSDGDPINYWGRYVHTIVSRYSDPARFTRPVKHWEIWNEVDDGAWNYFWTGSEADYAQLLKVGYQATKDTCPDCTVLYAGLLYWADQTYFERVLDILNDDASAPANNFYFDAMSVHLYSRSSTVYDTINLIRSRMKQYVPDRPIWLTETGVMVWDDATVDPYPVKYDMAAREEEAAAYVVQSYANAWASGVERYFFFRANDEDMIEYFGLMRNDRSYRPSYVAYQVARTHLMSPTMVTNWTYSSGVRRVTLWGTPEGKISVLWNERPQTQHFDYVATLPTATRVDQRGIAQTLEATDGRYEIDLPGATANLVTNPDDYIIGGEPYLIIEEDTVAPSAVVLDPLPATTYSNTIAVSWSASDASAGVWGVELQMREGSGGEWSNWLGLAETENTWSAAYRSGTDATLYCFRARAWDKAGNIGPWSDDERCTRLQLNREVALSVGPVFGDENGNGAWDSEPDEQPLDNVTFQLLDGAGSAVLPPSCGQTWNMTATLKVGGYTILVEPEGWPLAPPGWLPRRLSIAVSGGEAPLVIEQSPVGLLPHRSSSYLPLTAQDN